MNKQASQKNINGCQMQSIPEMHQDKSAYRAPKLSLITSIRLRFRRHLNLDTRRKLKKLLFLNYFWQPSEVKNRKHTADIQLQPAILNLKAGDRIKIRSRDEILATLDNEGKLKGCSFINVMWQYCGTTQRVLKPVNRFVDERNYQIKITRGMVLLEGIMCTGTDFYGECDRSCLFFWREEWLEKI
jgi:hypothetical protein